jgi:glycosyltransferase involved in cell wall biosynthesis
VQGLSEIVRDGVDGRLVPPDDPAALARVVGGLLDDPALAHRLAETGAASARVRFSPERYASDMAAAVADAVGSATRR